MQSVAIAQAYLFDSLLQSSRSSTGSLRTFVNGDFVPLAIGKDGEILLRNSGKKIALIRSLVSEKKGGKCFGSVFDHGQGSNRFFIQLLAWKRKLESLKYSNTCPCPRSGAILPPPPSAETLK